MKSLLAALLIGIGSPALADAPGATLTAVRIQTKSEKLSGYIGIYPGKQYVDIQAENALEQLKAKYPALSFVRDLTRIQVPYPALVSTSGPSRIIRTEDVLRIEASSGPFAGVSTSMNIQHIAPGTVALLNRSPIYQCRAAYSEMPGIYWISFNEKHGQAALDAICNRAGENAPRPDEERKLLKQMRGVIRFEGSGD